MKRFTPVITLAFMLGMGGSVFGQTDTSSSSIMMEDNNVNTQPKTENKVTKKPDKSNLRSNDNLFDKKKKSWAIGVHGGYPLIVGDLPSGFGISYGGSLQKALGHSFALRLSGTNGWATGAHFQPNSSESLKNNAALNGTNDPASNYVGANAVAYTNYRMNFTHVGLDGIFYFNNVNFLKESSPFGIYLFGGVGGMLFDTWVDQLDASGNMYNYSPDNVPRATSYNDKKTVDALKKMRDGNYETRADGNKYGYTLADRNLTTIYRLGAGMQFRLSKRIGLNIEGSYGHTGNDLLDGQRWANANTLTHSPDALVNLNLGLNIRLGRTDNVYWFTNPLAMPYKTIMENKKKLQKVDKLEKDVDNMGKRLDTLNDNVNTLMADSDNDGVSDHFDKEDGTPEGAVVNGAGETILFKDKDGNLVYNDPNVARKKAYSEGKDSDGNYVGADGTSKDKKGKIKFDANDPDGKTMLMFSDSKGGLKSPGTNSSAGYLPAIFFSSNTSKVSQSHYPELYEVARIVKQNPNMKLRIIGHADHRNTEAYNKALGLQRAQAVAYALEKNFGVPKSQLIVESKGEVEPLANAKGMDALAANRRVQFAIDGQPDGNTKTDVKSPEKPKTNTNAPVKKEVKKEVKNDPNTPMPDELNKDVNQLLNEEEKPADDVLTPDTDF